MYTENLSLDYSGKWKVIEQRGEYSPYIGISVFSDAFIVESIELSHCPRLATTSEDGDSIGISDFQSNKECDRLNGEVPSINIVTCEQIVAVR